MPNLVGDSNDPAVAAVLGTHTAGASAVIGQSDNGRGVLGLSVTGQGVWGESKSSFGTAGVSETSSGVQGSSKFGVGVVGLNETLQGGIGDSGIGVLGAGNTHGVLGRSDLGLGVEALTNGNTALIATAVSGEDTTAFIVNQRGAGRIMIGRNADNAEVFRILVTGDVEVRGVILASDANVKTNCCNVDTREILEKLACMPVGGWNYKADPASVRHIGPTSQDFHAAFGLNGGDSFHISTVDAQGIALAAIQGLNEKLKVEIAGLRTDLANLEARIATLQSKS